MKKTLNFLAALIMLALPAALNAQVKQVFQVLDFDTKQPVAGATSSLYGQKLTTNTKGVAVANLTVDKKEAFLPLEKWEKDGLLPVGRTEECYFMEYQTTDTIKYYMVEAEVLRKEVEGLSVQLYRFWYDKVVMDYLNGMKDSIRKHPEQANAIATEMSQAVFNTNSSMRMRWVDADNDLNRFSLSRFEKPEFAEVLQRIRVGDVDSATSLILSRIDTTDNSRASLERIDLFRLLNELYLSKDTTKLSDYTVYLYRNHYSPDEAAYYIQALNRDERYEMADSIILIEKPRNRNPRLSSTFDPSWGRYFAPLDKAKLKTNAETCLNSNKECYRQYPYFKSLRDCYWMYKNLYPVYYFLEDSVSAVRSLDTATAYLNQYFATYPSNPYYDAQLAIKYNLWMADNLQNYPIHVPDSLAYSIYERVYQAAKENYDRDTASLFQKVQLAECAVIWLQNAPAMEGMESRRMEVMRQLDDVAAKLSAEFPDFYALQNVQTASQLLATCLMQPCDNEAMLDAFRRYEKSFDAVNALYPKVFISSYRRFNALADGYLTTSQQSLLASEFSDFTDRLLKIETDNDPQRFLVAKAEYANGLAEQLYQGEAYDEAVGYYLQACEMYEKAIPNDPELWVPYLRNYLQMGDAHLYQNQYDKAVMTYQKILDFEPQIPTSMTPQYTRMKGNVHYYIGDVRKATGEMAAAEKEYKQAEKFFKKAASLGDTNAYTSMGEMYWGKAVVAAQNKDLKKCRQMVEKSVTYYESTSLDTPLKTYERAKSIMGDFYKEEKDTKNYYRTIGDLTEYYRKFTAYGTDYASKLVQNAETMLNSDNVTKEDALTYSQDIMHGLIFLYEAGEEVELPYLRGMFNLARVYMANDSLEQAIGLYKDCLSVNEYMFKDTAKTSYLANMAEVYTKLALCYEGMAEEIDTAHAENWYYRAIDTRDTLIDLLKELNDDGDVNLTYRTAIQYRNNGGIFYHLEMIPSAQDYFDKSNELLLMLYNSEYKEEVEEDIIQNYFLKGAIFHESGNDEKALENLRKATGFGERIKSDEASGYYIASLSLLIEILEKDAASNADEIARLTKQLKEHSKKLK